MADETRPRPRTYRSWLVTYRGTFGEVKRPFPVETPNDIRRAAEFYEPSFGRIVKIEEAPARSR